MARRRHVDVPRPHAHAQICHVDARAHVDGQVELVGRLREFAENIAENIAEMKEACAGACVQL